MRASAKENNNIAVTGGCQNIKTSASDNVISSLGVIITLASAALCGIFGGRSGGAREYAQNMAKWHMHDNRSAYNGDMAWRVM